MKPIDEAGIAQPYTGLWLNIVIQLELDFGWLSECVSFPISIHLYIARSLSKWC